VPGVATYGAASSAGERASSFSRPHISCGRCSVMPLCRPWSSTVLPSARAKGSAAPVDLTSLAAVAAPCHRAGYGRGPAAPAGGGGPCDCSGVRRRRAVVVHMRACRHGCGAGCATGIHSTICLQWISAANWPVPAFLRRRHPYSCQLVCIECGCRQASGGWCFLGLAAVVLLKALGVGQHVAPVVQRQASHISCEWGGALPSCHR